MHILSVEQAAAWTYGNRHFLDDFRITIARYHSSLRATIKLLQLRNTLGKSVNTRVKWTEFSEATRADAQGESDDENQTYDKRNGAPPIHAAGRFRARFRGIWAVAG
jgi:hypothetical protein